MTVYCKIEGLLTYKHKFLLLNHYKFLIIF